MYVQNSLLDNYQIENILSDYFLFDTIGPIIPILYRFKIDCQIDIQISVV